jgi:hypothetical protein
LNSGQTALDRIVGEIADSLLGVERAAGATREIDKRRQYFHRPADYIEDILLIHLTHQQGDALDLIEKQNRVLIPSGHNLGKTFLLSAYGLYFFDVCAAQPDPVNRRDEQGARVLLPGPDHSTIFMTLYSEMLVHANRAEAAGHLMPGRRSEDSVLWKVEPKWEMEAMAPMKRTGRAVAHGAAGRHHANQIALVEEGQGVDETLWQSVEGTCTSKGNKIISSFNPTENSGPTFRRAKEGTYSVIHLDAFDHPNIAKRTYVIPAAVDFQFVDDMVRQCTDRGPYPDTRPDPDYLDFTYALPPVRGAAEVGPREDGFRGHPRGELRTYRPVPLFQAKVRGQWPTTSSGGLFVPGAWDAAVTRWKETEDPENEPPDNVGVDPAREGRDESSACPRWGLSARQLLSEYAFAEERFDELAMMDIRESRRIRIGRIRQISKGDGEAVAQAIAHRFPGSPWAVDEGGVGTSVLDFAKRIFGMDAYGVSFNSSPDDPIPGQRLADNLRAQMYLLAAMLVNRGLVDIPDDSQLREEAMATGVVESTRTVKEADKSGRIRKVRKASIKIEDKKDIKQKIGGRSPDKLDSLVLALHEAAAVEDDGQWVW